MDRAKVITRSLLLACFLPGLLCAQCDLGRNYAVFFGVSDYDQAHGWNALQYPVQDIRSLAAILRDHYDFETILLANPQKEDIFSRLQALKTKTDWSPHDQLLLFFSGHGENGYFIPVNAQKTDLEGTAVAFDDKFLNLLNDIPCNHQLVIMDACYSGSLFSAKFKSGGKGDWKDAIIEDNGDKNLQVLCSHQSKKTRLALTAAKATSRAPDRSRLVEAFRSMLLEWSGQNEILYTGTIYQQLRQEASTPLFGEFHLANNAGSSFLFIPKAVRQQYEQAVPCPIDPRICAYNNECEDCPNDPDERFYPVTEVKGILWMTENLNFRNYGNSSCADCEHYGRLYTWEDARTACESLGKGWRLPTVDEWRTLSLTLGEGYGIREMGAAGRGDARASFEKMKTSRWRPVLGGFRDGKKYKDQGREGLYWSIDPANDGFDARVLSFSRFGVFETTKPKWVALSCRCVRD